MIVTLTANPSFDRTIALSGRLERGGVLRAEAALEQAGGKGVNISRAATVADVPTVAVFPAEADAPFTVALRHDGIRCHPVAPTGDVRVNLTLTEHDGTTTKINSAGAAADAELLDRMRGAVSELATGAAWVVLAGSVPPGTPDGWYAEVAAALSATGARVAVDTSDAPLLALAAALGEARPDIIKPNSEELALLTGGDAGEHRARPGRRGGGGVPARAGRCRHRAGHPRGRRGRARHPSRRLARHPSADHGRQHRRGRRLQPVRLPARRPAR